MAIIAILCNDTTYLKNTRIELIEALRSENHDVFAVCEVENHRALLEQAGCEIVQIHTGRRGTNPAADIKLMDAYLKILKKRKPDIVLSFNIKPNVYGGMACRILKIKYIPNITGLGKAVEYPGKMQMLTTKLYKMGTFGAQTIFFQNTENEQFFHKHNMLSQNTKTVMLPGSGVPLERFQVMPYPADKTVRFLFVSRILKEKGIDLYLEAARYIRSQYPNTEFHICGGCDEEKYLTILEKAEKEGYILYHGEQKDMKPWFEQCSCLVHPSYYPEGMSNVLLEAAACARPVITTDRAGCRETVDNGISGYVVPIKDQGALNHAIETLVKMGWNERQAMGQAGREKVQREFDRQIVVRSYLEVINFGLQKNIKKTIDS